MPALRGGELRPGADQVGEPVAVGGLHHSSARHIDRQVGALSAIAVRTGAGLAVARRAQRPAVEVEQRRGAGVDPEDDVAAPAPVAAVRAAERLELLPVNRGAAVAAAARLDLDHCLVSEFRHVSPLRDRKHSSSESAGATQEQRWATTGPVTGDGPSLFIDLASRRAAAGAGRRAGAWLAGLG